MPRYHGTVETDMGIGIVTQLMPNTDGSWPKNLRDLLPVSTWSDFFADRKTARQVLRFRDRCAEPLPTQCSAGLRGGTAVTAN